MEKSQVAANKDEENAYFNLITSAMETKIEKYPLGGVMVLEGPCSSHDRELQRAVALAFSQIRSVEGSDRWTYVFLSRSNSVEFYSAIFSPNIEFEERG